MSEPCAPPSKILSIRSNQVFRVIAFMENSSGYQVTGKHFPAVAVGHDFMHCISRREFNPVVEHLHAGENPLWDGYSGMIVACGRIRGTTDSRKSWSW
jgi:hypothetical protein